MLTGTIILYIYRVVCVLEYLHGVVPILRSCRTHFLQTHWCVLQEVFIEMPLKRGSDTAALEKKRAAGTAWDQMMRCCGEIDKR